jgi:LPS O-antigen subunit length determinant protein (WzzB/FepE family)
MERLSELISKLKEQFEQKADSSKLLATTLLIERELMKAGSAQTPVSRSSKVSVMMPASRNGYKPAIEETITEDAAEAHEEPIRERVEQVAKKSQPQEFLFDPLTEIPTLSQQHSIKEINEMLGIRDASLNDKLKENKVEVGHVLTEHPIKDLKKAIGINDRYVFINELFRGDEVMYERSLKTINGFRIFAEAEYWIERELKVKLGWEEHKDTTRHFHQLIKRRFS